MATGPAWNVWVTQIIPAYIRSAGAEVTSRSLAGTWRTSGFGASGDRPTRPELSGGRDGDAALARQPCRTDPDQLRPDAAWIQETLPDGVGVMPPFAEGLGPEQITAYRKQRDDIYADLLRAGGDDPIRCETPAPNTTPVRSLK